MPNLSPPAADGSPGPEPLSGGGVPVEPELDESGVDRTLVRACLDLSPAERIDLADAYAQEIEALRPRLDVAHGRA